MCNESMKNFSEAMVEFVSSSEKLASAAENPCLKNAVEKICGLLGIAKLEVIYKIPNKANELFLHNETFSIFSHNNWDENRPFTIVKHHEDGCVSDYSGYPYKDGSEWSDEDKNRISAFISAVYLVNDRARIASVAEKFAVRDNEMELYNLRYFMKTARAMFASGKIREYCACRFNIAKLSVINAKLGRNGGTEIMKQYVYGLRDLIGEDGFTSRLGGDNFITLFKKNKTDEVMRYLSGIVIPTKSRGTGELFVSAHAGYYEVDNYCRGPHEIMEAIIIAEAASRNNRKTPYAVFNDELKKRVEERKLLESLFF